MIENQVLDSGARVFIDRMPFSEILSIGFWINKGSRDEPSEMSGFSHFIEHMLFKGTGRYSARDIALRFDRIGADINAYTDAEALCLHCTLPAEEHVMVVDLFTEMIFHSQFRKEDIELEKLVILNEILAVADDPEERGNAEFFRRLWPSQRLSRPIEGTLSGIENLSENNLRGWYDQLRNPENLIVSVAGKVPDTFIDLLNGKISPGDKSGGEMPQHESPENSPGIHYVRSEIQQIQFHAGVSFPNDRSIDTSVENALLSLCFGETMSSRLFQHIREDRGLCYHIYSFFNEYRDRNLFGIYAACGNPSMDELTEALHGELDQLVRYGLEDREMSDARQHMIGQLKLQREDVDSRMKRMVFYWNYYGVIPETDEILTKIQQWNGFRTNFDRLKREQWTELLWGNIDEQD